MSNRNAKIQVKHSGVIGSVPASSFLEYGELALNYADDKLYYKNSSNSIRSITSNLLGDVTGTQLANTIADTTVTGKLLTNYSSTPGTISAADTILTAFNKLSGNAAQNASITSPTFITSIGLQYDGTSNRLNLTNLATLQWLRDDSGSIQRIDTLVPAEVTTGNRNWTLPPTSGTLATTSYVDTLAQGLSVHESAHVILKTSLESLGAGTVTYTNGTNGVGAKLTLQNALTQAMLDGDADALTVGARIIVAGQTNQALNGIYTYSTSTELIRATDFDEPAEAAGGDFVFVTHGIISANTGWVLSEKVTTIGSSGSPFIFQQFSGTGTFTAGNGLTLVGGTDFNVTSTGPGSLTVGADTINLTSGIVTTGTYKSVTVDTFGRVTAGSNPTTLAGYGITDAVNAVATIVPISAATAFDEASNAKIFHVSNTTTLTLPAASTISDGWSIGIVNVGGSPLTINRSASDTINGTLTTFTNSVPYSAVYIYKSSATAFIAIGVLY
jgi:hypothetical protein